MNRVYEHLSNSVIPNIQQWNSLSRNHVEQNQNEKTDPQLKLTVTCSRCGHANSRDSTYCNKCGSVLDEKRVAEALTKKTKLDKFLEKLEDNPEKIDKLESLMAT